MMKLNLKLVAVAAVVSLGAAATAYAAYGAGTAVAQTTPEQPLAESLTTLVAAGHRPALGGSTGSEQLDRLGKTLAARVAGAVALGDRRAHF